MTTENKPTASADVTAKGLVCNDLLGSVFMEPKGYVWSKDERVWWHWSDVHSSGAALIDGKWFPCSMMDNGSLDMADEPFDTPASAAKRAISYFS